MEHTDLFQVVKNSLWIHISEQWFRVQHSYLVGALSPVNHKGLDQGWQRL